MPGKGSKKHYEERHGGQYIDRDGNTKQFTYIDHDKKTNISVSDRGELDEIRDSIKEHRKNLIERILTLPASICPLPFTDFTVRGENVQVITWNETMLKDNGLPMEKLQTLCNILENRYNSLPH